MHYIEVGEGQGGKLFLDRFMTSSEIENYDDDDSPKNDELYPVVGNYTARVVNAVSQFL